MAKWTEARVIDALRESYLPASSGLAQEEWAFLTQVLLRAPDPRFAHLATQNHWTTNQRKIDVLLVRNWAGGKQRHERVAIEVKVTRADYRSETDLKRGPAEAAAHRCAYAAPAGLIDPATLPEGWGLIEVSEDGRTTWKVKAVRRVPTADLDYLISAGFRRASRAEEKIRRGETEAAQIAALRAENQRLKGMTERAVEARDREMARAKAARSDLMRRFAGKPVCATCGEPVDWVRGRYRSNWEHKDTTVERVCSDARLAEYRAAHAAGMDPEYPSCPEPIEVGEWQARHPD